MKIENPESWEIILKAATMIGAVIAFVYTYHTWEKANKVKRSEFLESLIKEFNGPNTFLARKLLDDFGVYKKGTQGMSDEQLLGFGNLENFKDEDLSYD